MKKQKKPTNSAELELQHLRNKLALKSRELKGDSPDIDNLFQFGCPVSPKEFIESKNFYGNSITNEIYPWIIDTMEEIFSGEYHAPKYETVVCLCGIGSGKGTLAAACTSYMVYWLLSFKSLRKYFATKNITWADDSTISFMNMAPTKGQAKKIVFDKVTKFIHRVKFLRDTGWMPDPNITSELIFREKNPLTNTLFDKLQIVPGNSSKTFTLGYSIFGGVIDESCFFREKYHDPCKDIYEEMDGRRKSRFQQLGITLLTSSANTEGDYTQELARKSEEDPSIYFIRKSIYDCKPEYFNASRFDLKVQREKLDGSIENMVLRPPVSFKQDYARNKNKALRDLDAIPSVAGNPFFSDFTLLTAKINHKLKDPCPDLGANIPESPMDVQTRLPPHFVGRAGTNYRIHIDLAKGDVVKGLCGVGFAMAHKIHSTEVKFKIKLDLAVRFKAPPDKEVNINEILDLIQFLRNERKFKIDLVTFDQWNSMHPIQIINSWKNGITADELRVGYKEYTYLKNLIHSDQLECYWDNNLMFEFKRLEDHGTSIEPAPGSMKDEADAVAGAIYNSGSLKSSQEELPPRATRGATVPRTASPIGRARTNIPGSVYRSGVNQTPRYRQ